MIAAIFYAPFLFELFLVGLTAFRAWEHYRLHPDRSNTALFYVLYRGECSYAFLLATLIHFIDGAIFFFVIAAFRLWNIWIVSGHVVLQVPLLSLVKFEMQSMTKCYLGLWSVYILEPYLQIQN
jgi:hypothetical protein